MTARETKFEDDTVRDILGKRWSENVVRPDSVLGVSTPPCRWGKPRFAMSHTLLYSTPSRMQCISVLYFLPLELCKNLVFFQFLVYFGERKCHESCTSQISFFRVKTWAGVLTTPQFTSVHIKRRDKSLATTRFLDTNTSRQFTCLRNCWRRPIGWLVQQSALCHAAIADQYWKNQSHKGSVETVVILSEMPSVVCTSINDNFFQIFSQSWLVQGGSISSSAQFTVHCGIIKELNAQLNLLTHFTLWKISHVAHQEEVTVPTSPISTPLSQVTSYIFCLIAKTLSLIFLITGVLWGF